MQGPVPFGDIWAPLDTRRHTVRSVPWQPLMLSDLETGRQTDMVQLMSLLMQFQHRTQHVLPVLVDMNIHYRAMKMVYSVTYAKYDIKKWLVKTPIVYGIWHPYKYACTLMYRRFLPFFCRCHHR